MAAAEEAAVEADGTHRLSITASAWPAWGQGWDLVQEPGRWTSPEIGSEVLLHATEDGDRIALDADKIAGLRPLVTQDAAADDGECRGSVFVCIAVLSMVVCATILGATH